MTYFRFKTENERPTLIFTVHTVRLLSEKMIKIILVETLQCTRIPALFLLNVGVHPFAVAVQNGHTGDWLSFAYHIGKPF